MGAVGISWVDARDGANHPIMYRITLPPQTKKCLAQTVNNAKVEKLELGFLTLQLTLCGCVLKTGMLPACGSSWYGSSLLTLRGDPGCRPQKEIRAAWLCRGHQAPLRTASDCSLLGFTHLQRSGEQSFLVGSCPGVLPERQ